MTTLIGCRCKSGNIFSQALLIGRGLFLNRFCVEWVSEANETRSIAELKERQFCESKTKWMTTEREAIICSRLKWWLKLYFMQSSAYKLKPRIIGNSKRKVCWWPIVGKPPVPIPNTVVKTYRGENTWRATSWEDSTLPTSNLDKARISRMIDSLLLLLKE